MTVVAAGAAIYASTNAIDIEEEIDVGDSNTAIIDLKHEPVTSSEEENVVGKIVNADAVDVVKIKVDRADSEDFKGISWTSGWVDLLDEESGVFDIDVLLEKGKINHFKVYACDKSGTEIEIANPLFDIRHNDNALRAAAPPATASIGVQVKDAQTGYDYVDIVVEKNTPLPSKPTEKSYKLSRDINPLKEDVIVIKIWEGENRVNPEANDPAGEITIQSTAMDRTIPKGTEVDLTITADVGRKIIVTGYIPDFDYIIPEHTLRPEAKMNMSERMENVDERIRQSEVSIKNLKDQGVDVSELEDELEQVKAAYDDTYEMIDTDEQAVKGFVDHFSEIETGIIEEERKHESKRRSTREDDKVAEGRQQVEDYGDDDAKEELEELEASYEAAETQDEKEFIADKISRLGFMAMTSNFDWLKGFFDFVLSKPETQYNNPQKAEYWKSQGYQAIENRNVAQLRNAVFELLDLMTSSSNQAIKAYGSDLMK